MFITKQEFEAEIRRINKLINRSININYQARVYLSSNQSTTNATWVQVQLNGKDYDPYGIFNFSTYTYVVPVTGYYLIHAQVTFGLVQSGRYIISINDGSDRVLNERQLQTVSNYEALVINDILYFPQNTAIKLWTYQSTGGSTPVIYAGIRRTYLSICQLI